MGVVVFYGLGDVDYVEVFVVVSEEVSEISFWLRLSERCRSGLTGGCIRRDRHGLSDSDGIGSTLLLRVDSIDFDIQIPL